MTPIARKIAISRAGKGEPSGIATGNVRIPAKVTAPFTPASAATPTNRGIGRGRISPRNEANTRPHLGASLRKAGSG